MNFSGTIQSLRQLTRKRLWNPRVAARIRASKSPVVRHVGAALEAHAAGTLAPGERWWIDRIEALRAEVNLSTEAVAVPDYGARSTDEILPEEEMSRGRMTTEIVGEACQSYSKPRQWATLMHLLITRVKPRNCLEMGTCLGFSAAYQASALELNGAGKLVTLEGAPSFAAIASRNLELLGLAHRASVVVGRFDDTFESALNDLGSVDYAFIDGHHEEQATIRYFQKIQPRLSNHSMIV